MKLIIVTLVTLVGCTAVMYGVAWTVAQIENHYTLNYAHPDSR